MSRDGSADLALVLADPRRVLNLRAEEIPSLLGAIEELRAVLWTRMLRTPEPTVRDAGGLNDELLTVGEVAAELKFTTAYVYEAVRQLWQSVATPRYLREMSRFRGLQVSYSFSLKQGRKRGFYSLDGGQALETGAMARVVGARA